MTTAALDLASLLCSRLCHDLLSPVGALTNGLELLSEEQDPEMRQRCFELLEVAIDELLPQFDEDGKHAESIRPLPVSIEAALENTEMRAQVRACIAELPEQYRAVIVLRDLQELNTAEVATLLGVSENAVKIRLHRAHQALRTHLVRRLGEHS